MADVYFEDIAIGDSYESDGRTVTESEIINFADQFDPQPFHVDTEAAREMMFDGIIASGVHTMGICQRLATDAFYGDAAFLVGRGVDDLRFPNPTYPGDTLSVEVEILDKRSREGRSDSGHVDVEIVGFNQDGQQIAGWTALAIIGCRDTD